MIDKDNSSIEINQDNLPAKPTITPQDLDRHEDKLVYDIINAPDKETLEQQFELFNIAQSKKNAIRVSKLNKLLDMIEDQAIDRFTKRPDQVSNKELLEYMGVVSSQIERAKNDVNTDLSYKPSIQVNQTTTEVNVNLGDELDRASKEKVMSAISSLLQQVQTQNSAIDADTPVAATPSSYIEVESEVLDPEDFVDDGESNSSNSITPVLYDEDNT